MKIKLITALTLSSLLSLSAISIDEAVSHALVKNQDLMISILQNEEKEYEKNKAKANFLPNLDLQYSYNNRDKVISGNKEDSRASAIISYNLFNGFKDTNLYHFSKNDQASFEYLLSAKKADVSLEVKTAYISYLNFKQGLNTNVSAFTLFEKQYEDSSNKYDQGLLAKNDLLKIQVNMLDSKQNVIKSRSDLKVSKHRLSNLLGGLNLQNEKIEDLSENNLSNKTYDIKSLDNRSEIQALKFDIKALKNSLKSSKSSFYPKVDASYSYNKYGDDFSLGNDNTALDSQNITNVSASWNIFSGGKDKNEVNIAKLKINEKKLALEKLKLDIKLQFDEAVLNLEVALQNLEISTLALEQSKINYEIVSNRFNEGISSPTDLIDANYLLTQAKQRYYSAFYSKFLAYASLDRITNTK